jgi:hypothetical protein
VSSPSGAGNFVALSGPWADAVSNAGQLLLGVLARSPSFKGSADGKCAAGLPGTRRYRSKGGGQRPICRANSGRLHRARNKRGHRYPPAVMPTSRTHSHGWNKCSLSSKGREIPAPLAKMISRNAVKSELEHTSQRADAVTGGTKLKAGIPTHLRTKGKAEEPPGRRTP